MASPLPVVRQRRSKPGQDLWPYDRLTGCVVRRHALVTCCGFTNDDEVGRLLSAPHALFGYRRASGRRRTGSILARNERFRNRKRGFQLWRPSLLGASVRGRSRVAAPVKRVKSKPNGPKLLWQICNICWTAELSFDTMQPGPPAALLWFQEGVVHGVGNRALRALSVRMIVRATARSVMVLAALVLFGTAGGLSPSLAQVKAPSKAKLRPPAGRPCA